MLDSLAQNYRNNSQALNALGEHERFIVSVKTLNRNGDDIITYNNQNLTASIRSPKQLLGRQLNSGQYAIILWSDGTTQIIIADSDRQRLNDLSREQLMFIADLYPRTEMKLTQEEWKLFSSLNYNMKEILKKNYKGLCEQVEKQAALAKLVAQEDAKKEAARIKKQEAEKLEQEKLAKRNRSATDLAKIENLDYAFILMQERPENIQQEFLKLISPIKYFVFKRRLELLPAILNKGPGEFGRLQRLQAVCQEKIVERNRSENIIALEDPCITRITKLEPSFERTFWHEDTIRVLYDEKIIEYSKCVDKNYLNINLISGDFSFVGWSNDTLNIQLHDSDLQKLHNLTLDQANFIVDLAKQPKDICLNARDASLFYSLDSSMQANLKRFYPTLSRALENTTVVGKIKKSPVFKAAVVAALAAGTYYGGRWFFRDTDMGKHMVSAGKTIGGYALEGGKATLHGIARIPGAIKDGVVAVVKFPFQALGALGRWVAKGLLWMSE